MKVFQCINKVQAALARRGIDKSRKNQQQGYSFRGVDDVYTAISPILAEVGLVILPKVLSRSCTERQTSKGGVLYSVVVEMEFDLVAAEDGSKHTIKTFGEAMDSGDKATNKAMSAAYKYAMIQAFAIPTEGQNDADFNHPPETSGYFPQPSKPMNGNGNGHVNGVDPIKAAFDGAETEDGIKLIWTGLSPEQKKKYEGKKNEAKNRIAKSRELVPPNIPMDDDAPQEDIPL